MSYENAKLVLSGGIASRPYFQEICDLADTDQPKVVFDTSTRVTQKDYDNTRTSFTNAFAALGYPKPVWLQESIDDMITKDKVNSLLDQADVLLVTGGATKHGYEKWQQAGVTDVYIDRIRKGDVVASGGSAGAMIWFNQGYSDSMSYEVEEGEPWEYVTAQGARLFQSWVTAHHTDTDALGRDRRHGFVNFLNEHLGQWDAAIGIDTGAALICQNGIARIRDISVVQRPADADVYLYTPESNTPLRLSDGDTVALREL